MVLTRGTQELTDITLKDITGPLPATAGPGQGNAMQPSEALIKTWRQGGANVEPSTKMLALIAFLQEWETTGDKTICFSQCEFATQQQDCQLTG